MQAATLPALASFHRFRRRETRPFALPRSIASRNVSTLAAALDRFLADSEPRGDFFLGTLQGTQPFQLRLINFHRRSSKHFTLAFAILKLSLPSLATSRQPAVYPTAAALPCYGPIHASTTARSARTVSKLRPSSRVAALPVNCCHRKIAWST